MLSTKNTTQLRKSKPRLFLFFFKFLIKLIKSLKKKTKRINFDNKLLWWTNGYESLTGDNLATANTDEFEILRQNSPWPQRNHNCFYFLNSFMERCNDALELVQTMKHFQILASTVFIGGADNQSLDIITQEVYMKYQKAIDEFTKNVNDIMILNSEKANFETSFFHLRTTIKVN